MEILTTTNLPFGTPLQWCSLFHPNGYQCLHITEHEP